MSDRKKQIILESEIRTSSFENNTNKISRLMSLYKPVFLDSVQGSFFTNFLTKRISATNNLINVLLTLQDISYVLRCGYGLQEYNEESSRKSFRTVPSAGKKYPLELYVILFKALDMCKSGVYHYNVEMHTLEPLILKEFTEDNIKEFTPVKWLYNAHGMICITGDLFKMVSRYGDRGYRYVLLEAGHVAQNVLLAGVERKVSIVPIGGVNEREIEASIGLNNGEEKVLYTLFF